MSLLTVLKSVGKDLSHLEQWVNDGLKLAEPIVGVVDPPLAPIIIAIESALTLIPKDTPLSATAVQQYVTATATAKSVDHGCSCMNGDDPKTPATC